MPQSVAAAASGPGDQRAAARSLPVELVEQLCGQVLREKRNDVTIGVVIFAAFATVAAVLPWSHKWVFLVWGGTAVTNTTRGFNEWRRLRHADPIDVVWPERGAPAVDAWRLWMRWPALLVAALLILWRLIA